MEEQGNPESGWDYQPTAETQVSGAAQEFSEPAPDFQPFTWSASEYVAHQKSASWFAILGVASAILGLIVYLATGSPLSTFVVVLVCLSIAVFAARKPQVIPYELGDHGVKVGPRFYPYAQFKSFSVVDEGAISCIWLRSLKKYQPTVAMYFAPEDENTIVDRLSFFLPHEERAPDAFDRVSQRFRF